jgi:hypothetical protein
MKNARCLIKIGLVLALFLFFANCSLGTRTTSIRGRVHSGGQIVGGGDVRLSSKDKEATAQIGKDGYFRVSLDHPKGVMLEVKVLQPGFEHDRIEFNSDAAPQGEMDIDLRRLFRPGSTSGSNTNGSNSVNR